MCVGERKDVDGCDAVMTDGEMETYDGSAGLQVMARARVGSWTARVVDGSLHFLTVDVTICADAVYHFYQHANRPTRPTTR